MSQTATAAPPCGTTATVHTTCRIGRVLRRLAGVQTTRERRPASPDGEFQVPRPTSDFVVPQRCPAVLVRSPQCEQLESVLRNAGFAVHREDENEWVGSLSVSGASAEQVGELAASHGLVLHELRTEPAS